MSRPTWRGRPTKRALQFVLSKFGHICWLCGHKIKDGDASTDHVHPASTHPELEWEPTNWRPAHRNPAGQPHGCTTTGCRCPGNTGRRNQPWTQPPSRPW